MTADPCAQVRRWLIAGAGAPVVPSGALTAHVAGCAHCRGALTLLLAKLVAPPLAGDTSCDQCADDLPAYVEIERTQGATSAARTYPHVWWHLWSCPECAEGCENLIWLLEAEERGMLPTPPVLRPVQRLPALPPLRLGRGFLHAVFGPQLSLGARWHAGNDPLFLSEHELTGYRIAIHVHQVDHEHWELEITLEPPLDGQIVVVFGTARYRAVLVDGRVARVRAIPLALLADQTGPDMQIVIEHEQGHDAQA